MFESVRNRSKAVMLRDQQLVILGSCILVVVSCGEPTSPSTAISAFEACVIRGTAYFKEIGSYPTLSAAPNQGRLAEDVAKERCNRTTTAF